MNKQVRGDLENVKGRVKQAAGAISGDKKLEAEGAAERLKGAVQSTVEKAKNKLRDDDPDKTVDQEEETEE